MGKQKYKTYEKHPEPEELEKFDWENSFDKYGNGDGGEVEQTTVVAEYLEEKGFKVGTLECGLYNTIINKLIDPSGKILIHGSIMEGDRFRVGLDNARSYLPKKLVEMLDLRFKARQSGDSCRVCRTYLNTIGQMKDGVCPECFEKENNN